MELNMASKNRVRDLKELEKQFNLQVKRSDLLAHKLESEKKELEKKVKELKRFNKEKEAEQIKNYELKIKELEDKKNDLREQFFSQDRSNDLYELIKKCQNEIEQIKIEIDIIKNNNKENDILVNELKSNIEKLEKEKNYTSELASQITNGLKNDFYTIQSLDKQLRIESSKEEDLFRIKGLSNKQDELEELIEYLKLIHEINDINELDKCISNKQALIEKLKRDLQKNENSIKEKYFKNLNIHTFVIDGSNLCYAGHKENHQFVGILPLLVLIDFLSSKNCKTYIIFDGSFKQKCSKKELEILDKISKSKKYKMQMEILEHLTEKADEKILDLANQLKAYVISNDTYAELKNSEIVFCEKVLKFHTSLDKTTNKLKDISIPSLLIRIDLKNQKVENFSNLEFSLLPSSQNGEDSEDFYQMLFHGRKQRKGSKK